MFVGASFLGARFLFFFFVLVQFCLQALVNGLVQTFHGFIGAVRDILYDYALGPAAVLNPALRFMDGGFLVAAFWVSFFRLWGKKPGPAGGLKILPAHDGDGDANGADQEGEDENADEHVRFRVADDFHAEQVGAAENFRGHDREQGRQEQAEQNDHEKLDKNSRQGRRFLLLFAFFLAAGTASSAVRTHFVLPPPLLPSQDSSLFSLIHVRRTF